VYSALGSLYAIYTNTCACSFVLSLQMLVSEYHTFFAASFRPKTQSSMQFVIMHLMTGIKIGGEVNFVMSSFKVGTY